MTAAPSVLPVVSPDPLGVPELRVQTPSAPADPINPVKIPVEEYFALERVSEIRHEYVEGNVIPMPGESLAHNQIAGNFHTRFAIAFADRNCSVYMESVRVRVSPAKYRYPDVIALCGEPLTDNDNPPALLNPAMIVEVLSSSTQATDRGEKLFEYQQMPGLSDYVLAAQETVFVSHYARQGADRWTLTEHTKLTDTLTFISLDVTLTLADIYRKVAQPAP